MGSQCISSPPAELGSDFGRDGPEAGTKVSLLSCFSPLVLLGKWCLRAFGICFGALELVSKAGAVLSQGGPQLRWVRGARLRLSLRPARLARIPGYSAPLGSLVFRYHTHLRKAGRK